MVSRIVKAIDPCTADNIVFSSDPNSQQRYTPPGVENCEVIKPRTSLSFLMTAGHDLSLPNIKVIELFDLTDALGIVGVTSIGSWKLSLPNLHSLKGTLVVSIPTKKDPTALSPHS